MRQKVVIACGLVRDATTLLFDEPLTGLDPIGIRRMRETIVARGAAGAAILLSSHLLHLVEEVCTRVIIMDHGRKVADGTVAELASRADLAAAGSNLEQIFLRVTGHESDVGAQSTERCSARALYIIVCSARNRLRLRLRRLREPRYCSARSPASAISISRVFARMRGASSAGADAARAAPRRRPPAALPRSARRRRRSAALALLRVAALSWLLPFEQRAARVPRGRDQFLFPAPVTRRQLLIHRLMRSQLGAAVRRA